MNLREAVDRFIEFRKALGSRFVTQEYVLRGFVRRVDGEAGCDDVTVEQVCVFLAGEGPLTQSRALRYSVLSGFYRYAVSRGYASRSPLPDNEPKKPPPPRPYIYSRDDLRRIFGAIDVSQRRGRQLDPNTFRTLLALLCGAGLRGGEALRLRIADFDRERDLLTVNCSKFYKSRLVPVGARLASVIRNHTRARTARPFPEGMNSALLGNREGKPLSRKTVQSAFQRLLRVAGVHGTDDTIQSPCLHSFRHSFAVHRLTAWYREGRDVQRLLPVLSTYLGHINLSVTSVYLTMTPELLQEASIRLDDYFGASNDA